LEELIKLQVKESNVDTCPIAKAHTMTLYFFAQVYQHTGELSESARYCHQTLRNQYRYLGTDDAASLSVDHIEWALNAATLAGFFTSNEQYPVARHMMCAARKVLLDADQKTQQEERWQKASADLDRIEVRYCLTLLEDSYHLMQADKLKDYPSVPYEFK